MNIDLEMSFQQHEMSEMRNNRVPFPLFVSGYGAGKSFTLVYSAVRDILLFPGCKVGIYAPTHDLLDLNLVPAIELYLDARNIKHHMNRQRHVMTLPGNRQFFFRSMNDPGRIVAYEVYASHVDEADLMTSEKKATEAWNRIIARNRQVWIHPTIPVKPNGDPNPHPDHFNQVSAYSTPESYRFTYQRWKKEPGEGYSYVVAPTRSNWTLDPSFIKNLEDTYTPAQCIAYLEGIWTNIFTGSVYSYYNRDQHHTNRVIQNGDVLHIGQDFNYGGSCGAVYVPFTKLDKMNRSSDYMATVREEVKEEYDLTKSADIDRHMDHVKMVASREEIGLQMVDEYAAQDTEQIVEVLRDRYSKHPVIVYPDASGKSNHTNASASDIAILKGSGYQVRAKKSNPRITDRVNSVQRLLYNDRFLVNSTMCPKSSEALEEHAFSDITGLPEKFAGPATIDDRNDGAGYTPAFLHPIKKVSTTRAGLPI